MRAFLYYVFHAVKNSLKKLFKSWVIVFILVCVLMGGLIGMGASMLEDLANGQNPDYVETMTDGEPADTARETVPMSEVLPVVELVAAALILFIFSLETFSADKNGSIVFTGADVNLLFASPLEPQSVLMFRIITQIGATVVASVYMLFQIPNLVLNFGMKLWSALSLILVWFLILTFGKLYHVLIYTLASSSHRAKRLLRPVFYCVIAAAALGFFAYYRASGDNMFEAAKSFFNHPLTRYIPIYGWIKGFAVYAVAGDVLAAVSMIVPLVLAFPILIYIIWHLKADFYEDAMAKSAETAELQAAVQAEGKTIIKRKKDRSEKLRRDGLNYGRGASVYFFKAMYNRFRFAHFGIFTKTSETYLLVAVAAVALELIAEVELSFVVPALAMAAMAFIRSLGNPVIQDPSVDSFRMVPEPAPKKLCYSLLGGSLSCLMDLLPAYVVAAVYFGENPVTALAWALFTMSVDFYSSSVALFIDRSVPSGSAKTVKQFVQILFIYFGLLPDIVLVVLGFIFSNIPLYATLAAGLNALLGAVFFTATANVMERGK